MSDAVTVTDRGAVRVLTLSNPPVNGLGAAVRTALARAVAEAVGDDSVRAIVLTGAGKMFCAGADIREFGQEPPPGTPQLPDVIDTIERCAKPVVAAIHGVAAGGGFELALGCHARIATADARVGLPEVTLGIIPGAGGTQRLPRLVGVATALDWIVTGKLHPAGAAQTAGAIDQITTAEDWLADAVQHAERLADSAEPPRRTSELSLSEPGTAFEDIDRRIAKKARGFVAPYRAIAAVRAAVELPRDQAHQREREIFLELVGAEQARALRHVFFAEREVLKIPDVGKDVEARRIESVGVVGCGTMGSGIAMCFADAGIPVRVLETETEALEGGLARVRRSYKSSASKGRISSEEADARIGRIRGTTAISELADVDLVVEAVFESMEVKQDVFRRLDEACGPETLLATNTSTLDVNEIAAATGRPDRVIGTHFFSPAHIMKLMENVRARDTSKETIATVMALSKRIGKVAVLVGVCDGFVGNRMLYAYRRQADFLIEEGALPQDVDRALFEFGLPMGPFAMADLAGLDIGWAVRKRQAASRPKDLRYSPVADRICEMGRFGQKTGAGWYRYEDGSRTPVPDPVITELVEDVSRELGIERRPIGDEEIVTRCVHALVNEGAKILHEGIALRASDIDVVWIHGYGFPRYRGGPMFYADTVGLDAVLETMTRLEAEQGAWATPAPLLKELAGSGKKFADYEA